MHYFECPRGVQVEMDYLRFTTRVGSPKKTSFLKKKVYHTLTVLSQ